MHNSELLKQLGAFEKVTRPLDLGTYADKYAGHLMQCWVNPPALLDEYLGEASEETFDLARRRRAVSILFEIPIAEVNALDDQFMLHLFVEGTRLYREYHDALRKNSSGDSARI